MGQITTSVGLVSGIDTGALTDQLIKMDSKPKTALEQKNAVHTTKITAFQTVNAQMLSVKSSANSLSLPTTFNATLANSSNESVLTATTSKTAVPGSYSFVVKQLVSAQQTVTGGFESADADLGITTTFTYESAKARIDSKTKLSQLNGGKGIERGNIRITDRSGKSAFVDLSTAVTVDDVVNTINNTLGVNVVASISKDGLVINDNTGQTSANLKIEDVGSTKTATSLGLAKASTSNSLVGDQINTIGNNTNLALLNDGNGIGHVSGSKDFKIETSTGSIEVDISDAKTIKDVIEKINEAAAAEASVNVQAAVADDGVSLVLTDTVGGSSFKVTSLNGSSAAKDLGILGEDTDGDKKIDGDRLVASINSKLLKNVNGGSGLTQTSVPLTTSSLLSRLNNGSGLTLSGDANEDITVTDRDGDSYQIDLDGASTIQDVINAVYTGTGGSVSLALDGNKLVATDDTGGTSNFSIASTAQAAGAAESLGLAQSVANATMTGGDLNPLTQSGAGIIRIQNAAGGSVDINLGTAESFSDLIELINNSAAGVKAQLNSSGNGLDIVDQSGGNGSLVISDVSGGAATNLKIAGTFADKTAKSGNLQMQYISSSTSLNSLGVTRGKFTITDSSGATSTVDLTQGDENTIEDVIREINSRGLKITAKINDNGDGLELVDTGPGLVKIKVEESGSSTAADLGLLGEAKELGQNLDGSFEKKVEIVATDSLNEIAAKLNDGDLNMRATIINDGTSTTPYRLSMTTRKEGTGGAFVFDDGGADLKAFNLAEAQDAVLFYGSTNPADAMIVTSQSNTVKSLIPGVTVDLKSASNNPVQVTISRDDNAITESVKGFVDAFNKMIDTINKYDTYDQKSNTRGLLFGDQAIANSQRSLHNAIIHSNPEVPGRYHSLSEIGIQVGSKGKLKFDSAKLTTALQTDRDAVVDLFTWRKTEEKEVDGKKTEEIVASGIGVELDLLMKRLTDKDTSPIEQAIKNIEKQIEINKKKIEEWDVKLARKRTQYTKQFTNMEKSLAKLKTQSSAISSIQPITTSSSSS